MINTYTILTAKQIETYQLDHKQSELIVYTIYSKVKIPFSFVDDYCNDVLSDFTFKDAEHDFDGGSEFYYVDYNLMIDGCFPNTVYLVHLVNNYLMNKKINLKKPVGLTQWRVFTNGIIYWACQLYQFIDENGKKIYHYERLEEFDNEDEADSRLSEWKLNFWS